MYHEMLLVEKGESKVWDVLVTGFGFFWAILVTTVVS